MRGSGRYLGFEPPRHRTAREVAIGGGLMLGTLALALAAGEVDAATGMPGDGRDAWRALVSASPRGLSDTLRDDRAITPGSTSPGAGTGVWRALVAPQAATGSGQYMAYLTPADSTAWTSATTATECAGSCHVQQYHEWNEGAGSDMGEIPVWDALDEAGEFDPYDSMMTGSMHRLSWQDWEFQNVYHEQSAANALSCQRCHVPDTAAEPKNMLGVHAPSTRGLAVANASEGVTCVSCHLDAQGQLIGPADVTTEEAPHAVVGSELFDGVSICESCHNDTLYGSLTRTVQEYRESTASQSYTCSSCHMTDWTTGGIKHSFPGGHSPTMRGAALELTFPATAPATGFTVAVKNRSAGHNAPTGERFRAFKVAVRLTDTKGQVYQKDFYITNLVDTPTMKEVVRYNQVAPIPYGTTTTLTFDRMTPGEYKLDMDLEYHQIKDTWLRLTVDQGLEHVEAFGVSSVRQWRGERVTITR